MHTSLLVWVAHILFIEGSHMNKNTTSGSKLLSASKRYDGSYDEFKRYPFDDHKNVFQHPPITCRRIWNVSLQKQPVPVPGLEAATPYFFSATSFCQTCKVLPPLEKCTNLLT